MKELSKEMMLDALARLDQKVDREVKLIAGGGGALILAHGLSLVTHDIDAVPRGIDLAEIDSQIKEVAEELGIPGDWLNPYFATFSHTLPKDYEGRLVRVFSGKNVIVDALGAIEMLVMKCFAGRPKDVTHSKSLLKAGVDVSFVEKHLEELLRRGIPGAQEALDFLDELNE